MRSWCKYPYRLYTDTDTRAIPIPIIYRYRYRYRWYTDPTPMQYQWYTDITTDQTEDILDSSRLRTRDMKYSNRFKWDTIRNEIWAPMKHVFVSIYVCLETSRFGAKETAYTHVYIYIYVCKYIYIYRFTSRYHPELFHNVRKRLLPLCYINTHIYMCVYAKTP